MKAIFKISEIDSLPTNTIAILNDELGGISLAIKTNEVFKKVDFKLKKLYIKSNIWWIFLLKLDNKFYHCFVPFEYPNDKILNALINLDCFNLIVFNNSKEEQIYRIENTFKNKILMNIPDYIFDELNNKNLLNQIKSNRLSSEVLWDI